MNEPEMPLFLRYLDACVAQDPRATDLRGLLAFGVRDGEDEWWWEARCDGAITRRFSRARPTHFDAALLVGTRTAAALCEGRGPQSGEDAERGGDPTLLKRFLDRFLSAQTPLQLRMTR
jgi:hypothetical protein